MGCHYSWDLSLKSKLEAFHHTICSHNAVWKKKPERERNGKFPERNAYAGLPLYNCAASVAMTPTWEHNMPSVFFFFAPENCGFCRGRTITSVLFICNNFQSTNVMRFSFKNCQAVSFTGLHVKLLERAHHFQLIDNFNYGKRLGIIESTVYDWQSQIEYLHSFSFEITRVMNNAVQSKDGRWVHLALLRR